MSAIPDSNLDPTQAFERSAAYSPPAKSVAKLRARQAEIRGSGPGRDAAREDSIPYPRREIPGVA